MVVEDFCEAVFMDLTEPLHTRITHELAVLAYTRLTQDQASQSSITDGGRSHEAPPLAEELLAVDGRWGKELFFFRDVAHDPVDDTIPIHIQAALTEAAVNNK